VQKQGFKTLCIRLDVQLPPFADLRDDDVGHDEINPLNNTLPSFPVRVLLPSLRLALNHCRYSSAFSLLLSAR
jgi:hypothetical protein